MMREKAISGFEFLGRFNTDGTAVKFFARFNPGCNHNPGAQAICNVVISAAHDKQGM